MRFGATRTKGVIARGLIGQDRLADQGQVPLAPQTQFGAETPYHGNVQVGFRLMAQDLTASNRPSEHNIFNSLPIIVVAQLPRQKAPAFKSRLQSFRIHLPGGA